MTRIITNQNIYTEMTPNEAKELITIISMLQWDYIRGDHEEHSNDDRYIIGGFFYCLIRGLLKVYKKIKISNIKNQIIIFNNTFFKNKSHTIRINNVEIKYAAVYNAVLMKRLTN